MMHQNMHGENSPPQCEYSPQTREKQPVDHMTDELLQCIRLFFHNFQHHSGTQFKAVLEDQAMSSKRRAYHNIGVVEAFRHEF